MEFARGVAQRIVGGRTGNRLQGDPRPGREFLVGQERGQRGDRVLIAAEGQ